MRDAAASTLQNRRCFAFVAAPFHGDAFAVASAEFLFCVILSEAPRPESAQSPAAVILPALSVGEGRAHGFGPKDLSSFRAERIVGGAAQPLTWSFRAPRPLRLSFLQRVRVFPFDITRPTR
jgi:hypothetical protein